MPTNKTRQPESRQQHAQSNRAPRSPERPSPRQNTQPTRRLSISHVAVLGYN